MGNITGITKRDIFEIFSNGIEWETFLYYETLYYSYYGRIEEIDFLKRLYDLSNMESYDLRYANAEGDIRQNIINNDDYPVNWVFNDDIFGLLEGDDDIFLKFFYEVFHHEVRDENKEWTLFLDKLNKLLRADGYEL